jgi:hypothetical protein
MTTSLTFIYVGTFYAISSISWSTLTFETSIGVNARCILVTIIFHISTFVNIGTSLTVTWESRSALTFETTLVVSTNGILRASTLIITFIDIGALNAIAFISSNTFAFETTKGIGTSSMSIAVVPFEIGALVDVLTFSVFLDKSVITDAFERSRLVFACTIFANINITIAFVDIVASYVTFTSETIFTWAFETTKGVFTGSIGITVVSIRFAFVDINTNAVLAEKSSFTCACIFTGSVQTIWDGFVTIVGTKSAFIDIVTGFAISIISRNTLAFILTNSITTHGILCTVMGTSAAFVDVKAGMTVTHKAFKASESWSTATWKRSL